MSRIFTLLCLILTLHAFASKGPGITFKENKGQWPKKVSFAADLPAGQVFIEQQGLKWVLYNYADIKRYHDNKVKSLKENSPDSSILHGHVYQAEFINAKFIQKTPHKQQPDYYNYFLGNDPKQWASNVKAYEEVEFTNIYHNINAKFYGNNSQFKYDLIVKPGGSVSSIKLKYNYTEGLSLVNNKLVIRTSIGDILESIPEAYQFINGKKINVKCSFVLSKNEVSFQVGNYNFNYDLVIDPVVIVSSFSGTESVSFGLGIAPDSKGNMYLYSQNLTKNYPVTVGAIQTIYGGGYFDCTLAKYDFLGTSRLFSTYIGGESHEYIINCVIQDDEVAIFGTTESDTFPIVETGFQNKFGGRWDYFVIKLDTSGKTLMGSTYLGGSTFEGYSSTGNSSAYFNSPYNVGELIMDKEKNCYIHGTTNSFDYPTTQGAYRMYSDSNGLSDLVITKLDPKLTYAKWSTYYGGNSAHHARGVRLSRSGQIYAAATTISNNFPTTPGVVFSSSVSSLDMVVFSLDTLSGFPIASSYMGSRFTEALRFSLDKNDNVYLMGSTSAPNSITVTPGAYNINTGNFVFYKVNPSLSQINVIARFGYNGPPSKIEIDAMNVDSCGYIYFGGFGHPNLPVSLGALKATGNPNGSMYFGVFSPNFTSIKYASYYGGAPTDPLHFDHDDGGLNYFDDRGVFYHANCIEDNFPVTPNAFSTFNVKDSLKSGSYWIKNSDAFVKIDLQTFVNAYSSLGGQIRSCSPITTTFMATPNLGSVTIIPGDGSPAVNSNSLVYSYNVHGTYSAYVIAGTDPSTCNMIDSVQILIKYGPKPDIGFEDESINCNGNSLVLDAGSPGSKYVWNTGDTVQILTPPQSGFYKVTVDNGYCISSDSTMVIVEEPHNYSTPNAFTPNGDGINEAFCLKGWAFCNESFKVRIFNRWGEKVFESDDPDFCWDGKFKGELLSSDVYIYHIQAKYKDDKEEIKKGNITLIR